MEIKIVESGSMEPTIKTGSLVFIVPSKTYRVGDIITFSSSGAKIPTTHRIADAREENGTVRYTTKGDANEEADAKSIPEGAIIGTVRLAVPFAGYIVDFARQPLGFSLLIVLPALLIIVGELETIWRELRGKRQLPAQPSRIAVIPVREPEGRTVVQMIEIGCPIVVRSEPEQRAVRKLEVKSVTSPAFAGASAMLAFVSFGALFGNATLLGPTISYLHDTAVSSVNTLTASALDFSVSASGDSFGFDGTTLDTDGGAVILTVSPEEGSAPAVYRVSAQKIAGSDLFCNAILADAGSPAPYSGPLALLATPLAAFDDPWSVAVTLDPDAHGFTPGEVCVIDLSYTGYRADSPESGYFDEEHVTLQFSAPAEEAAPVQTFEIETFSAEVLPEETDPSSDTPADQTNADEPEASVPTDPENSAEESAETPEPAENSEAPKI
jgi:signal peptidase